MAIDNTSPNAQKTAFQQTRLASSTVESVHDKFSLCSFTLPNGLRAAFPVVDIKEDGGNRIIERERAYRDGAKLDDTGTKAARFTMELVFNNSIDEPDLDAFNQGTPLYPDVLEALVEMFSYHETGDLVVPTAGGIRAKPESYSRHESSDEPDTGRLTVTFISDNEDSVAFRQNTELTINAQGNRLALVAQFDAQSEGIDSLSLADVREFASELEALANGPADAVDDIRQASNTVQHSVRRVVSAFSNAGVEGRDLLLDPEASSAQRSLLLLSDIAARASNDSRRGRPKVISVTATVLTTLADIAAAMSQELSDLLAINPQLDDPLYIPAGTIIKVYANAETA